MPSKRQTTSPKQPSLIKYDEIEYEVEADHLTEIDGQNYVCLASKWCSKASDYNMGDDEVELQIKPGDLEIKTINELAKATVERKKQNKGKRVYACPYCDIEFKPGRRDHCLRHMNGDKERPVGCSKRKLLEKDVSQPSTQKPVYIKTVL